MPDTTLTPVVHSAKVVGSRSGLDEVEVVWQDVAADEWVTSAYVTEPGVFAVTNTIGGTPDTGERVSIVTFPKGHDRVLKLRYGWLIDDENPLRWGPFSNEVMIEKRGGKPE